MRSIPQSSTLARRHRCRKTPQVHSEAFLSGARPALAELLLRDYGLSGELTPLPGECDVNLRLATDDTTLLVKVQAESGSRDELELQIAALEHVAAADATLPVPRVVRTRAGAPCSRLMTDGRARLVWIATWLPGELLAIRDDVPPALCERLGGALARLDRALADFADKRADRTFKWDLRQAMWIRPHVHAIDDPELREMVATVCAEFERHTAPALQHVRTAVVHNDANDHNVLLRGDDLAGLIDFGDLCRSALVAEVAIAASYTAMHMPDPLVAIDAVTRGYHAELALTGDELALVVPLVEARLAVSITNSEVQRQRRPDDPYVSVSRADAERVLRRIHGRSHAVAAERLRLACGLRPGAQAARVAAFLREAGSAFRPVLPVSSAAVLDLSFASTTGGDDPNRFDVEQAAERIARQMQRGGHPVAIGRYAEPRPIYTDAVFGGGQPNASRRTVHLGVDVFCAAGSEVAAPLPGRVAMRTTCSAALDYGGVVVLAHELPDGTRFGTLYGHLAPASIERLQIGDAIAAGEAFAALGTTEENGGWPPHLHFQVLASDPDRLSAVPWGVADPDDLAAHLLVHPDPSPLLGLDERARYVDPYPDLAERRRARFAGNLRTSYERPLRLVRGHRHFLFDAEGRRFLDAYNNVPHVGHCHPRVVRAVQEQTALLATNTRYLHDGMQRYADRLRELLPPPLSVFFFTASGSEANELALRLARKHTGGHDVCVMDHGYHGHTNAAMAMSPYKFRQAGAPPKPDWVHVTVQPDVYRGRYRGDGAGTRFAAEVARVVGEVAAGDRGLAAYLCECLPSVGGQLELPGGFLRDVYAAVRQAGGVCIADDVQTALWRTGENCFGFEPQAVVPDVLVLGKPLGNGFPLGAVATTRAIADSFADGPEFFSTFGGSTVAMAAGLAVLDVMRDEQLAANAQRTGERILTGLRELHRRHACIGDVRGRGFFLGVELVRDPERRTPDPEAAAFVKNSLRRRRVLIGTDGPFDNVLKIRPPMSFDAVAADCLLAELDRAFTALEASATGSR
ncbi:MAG TPA: aminotransferase class III-fold pyridoxal phosphate-dependent enzyme [bacterium]|nr:aminotransferase class III-fold pyridoxal phosphate-dependent enzyme [bacterium]